MAPKARSPGTINRSGTGEVEAAMMRPQRLPKGALTTTELAENAADEMDKTEDAALAPLSNLPRQDKKDGAIINDGTGAQTLVIDENQLRNESALLQLLMDSPQAANPDPRMLSMPGAFACSPEQGQIPIQNINDTSLADVAVGIRAEIDVGVSAETDDTDSLVEALPVHDDTPEIVMAIPATQSAAKVKRFSRKHFMCCMGGVILAMIVGTVIGIFASAKNHTSSNGSTPTPSSLRVRLLPTIQIRIEDAFGADYFLDSHPSYPLRNKALQWIVYGDPLQLAPNATHLIQRYVLAVFQYETTQNEEWASCQHLSIGTCNHREGKDERVENHWLSGSHECRWAGISCQGGDKNVTIIALGKLPVAFSSLLFVKYSIHSQCHFKFLSVLMKLGGTIPTELLQLPYLTKLDLGGNRLTGTIPREISKLSRLTRLGLSANHLSGSLPSELADISHLEWLHVGGNSLSGTIHSVLFGLSELQTLALNDNQLTGAISIPAQSQSGLLSLALNGNYVSRLILRHCSCFHEEPALSNLFCFLFASDNWSHPGRGIEVVEFVCVVSKSHEADRWCAQRGRPAFQFIDT